MNRLGQEEQELLKAFEAGELRRTPNFSEKEKRHREYAKAMFKKDARINIRIFFRGFTGAPVESFGGRYAIKPWLPASSTSMLRVACTRNDS